MSLGLLLDARWGLCPCCGERRLWCKVRELGAVLWRTNHVTQDGKPCRYFSDAAPTTLGQLVEANPEAAS